jgi:hypothetical protein
LPVGGRGGIFESGTVEIKRLERSRLRRWEYAPAAELQTAINTGKKALFNALPGMLASI